MQFQQLRYFVTASACGSIRAAAAKLFVSQSAVSIAIKDLETELGCVIFDRTSRGITLTREGVDALGYAQRILDQVDIMEKNYATRREPETRFAIASMHNLLVAKAFGDFLDAHTDESVDFELRETYTNQIINDVADRRSDLGIIYMSNFTDQAIRPLLAEKELAFTSLFYARLYVVVGDNHPLAAQTSVQPEQLAPFDRYELEQGLESSTYYENEPISEVPHKRKIVLGDNSSLAAILSEHDGYSITTGISPANRTLSLVELDTNETMNAGFVLRQSERPGKLMREFIMMLCRHILACGDQIEPASAAFYYTRTKR